ncbi:MAG: InlB B-repeat-containing protein [Oscillospiraceae bacterium]|nr:InlB B-repeat-containing protein [Oscillospiraceae bacterium]
MSAGESSFTIPTPAYTISYSANGGSDAPGSQTKTHGAALTLSATKPTRTGYTFQGWATSNTATSAAYSVGASFTANANTTLYAVWKANTYTVSYNANGGSGAPGSQTKTHGAPLTLSSTKPTRDGYAFQGWATSNTATSAAYSAGASFIGNATTTLYAVWKANTYTITYNANGGSGAPSSQTKTYGATLTLSSTKPTRDGYTFQGWATSNTATSAAYSAGASFTTNANTTLYAVWKANTYTVSYNANGGVGAPSSQTKTHNAALTLSSTKPTRTDYVFVGWSETQSATIQTYLPSDLFIKDANTTLYAVWRQAQTTPTGVPAISVGSASAKTGGTVTIPITVTASPATASLEFILNYDSAKLELKSAVPAQSTSYSAPIGTLKNGMNIVFGTTGTDPFTASGTILTLTFTVKSGFTSGETSVSLSSVKATNADDKTVAFTASPGKVTVRNALYGDFTGNGVIDGTDTLWILRYVASGRNIDAMKTNFPTTITTFDATAADFTNNGTADGTDTLWILRYVAAGRNAVSMTASFPTSISFAHLG